MAVSNSFKAFLALSLCLTILPKLFIGTGFSNPNYGEVVKATAHFFAGEGYLVTSPVEFAGKDALLAMKGDCLMYVIPVAHQGWHQATVQQSVDQAQNLWFEFEGRLTRGSQEKYYPLIVYYISKYFRYLGIESGFPPVLALVTEGHCSVEAIRWSEFPKIPFEMRSAFGGGKHG